MKSVVVHYQEIALKGKNRPWFVARLVRNLKEATKDLDIKEVRVLPGRIEMVLGPDGDVGGARDRIANVFGIGNFAKAGRAPLDVDAIAQEILKDLGPENPPTFRALGAPGRQALSADVAARSSAKWAGASRKRAGGRSNLADPEFTIHVETLTNEAFYFFGKERGAGGLPVGVERQGRVPACRAASTRRSPPGA